MSEPSPAIVLESSIGIGEYPRPWSPRELERLFAPFPRHLSGSALSGHIGIRQGLLQPAQPEDRPPHQICQGRRRHRRRGCQEDIVKGYKVDTDTFIEVTKEELENVALESTRTIEIDEFVDRQRDRPEISIPSLLFGAGRKIGHDAFAVIRETIREMNKVAIGRVVLTNREHIIALEPNGQGVDGTLLRYPYEVRSADEYFDESRCQSHQGYARSAKHIVNQKAGHFEPDKFEDQYETALIDLINQKRAGKPITGKGAAARRERRRF